MEAVAYASRYCTLDPHRPRYGPRRWGGKLKAGRNEIEMFDCHPANRMKAGTADQFCLLQFGRLESMLGLWGVLCLGVDKSSIV